MHILSLLLAGCFEVFGIYLMDRIVKAESKKTKILLIILDILNFGVSLGFLSYAMQEIGMSVSYVIWTSIGAVGAVLIDIFANQAKLSRRRSICLAIIVASTLMLKIV